MLVMKKMKTTSGEERRDNLILDAQPTINLNNQDPLFKA